MKHASVIFIVLVALGLLVDQLLTSYSLTWMFWCKLALLNLFPLQTEWCVHLLSLRVLVDDSATKDLKDVMENSIVTMDQMKTNAVSFSLCSYLFAPMSCCVTWYILCSYNPQCHTYPSWCWGDWSFAQACINMGTKLPGSFFQSNIFAGSFLI